MVNLEVGRSFGPLLLLGVFATLVQTAHGAAVICPGPDPCVLEQSTGCSEFLETFDVSGTCCSLSQNSATGNCIVTISNGYCEIYSTVEGPNGCPPGCECNEETNEMSCVIPGTQWTSESDQPCPESEWVPPDADSSVVDTPLPPDADSSAVDMPLPPDADSKEDDTPLSPDADASEVDKPLDTADDTPILSPPDAEDDPLPPDADSSEVDKPLDADSSEQLPPDADSSEVDKPLDADPSEVDMVNAVSESAEVDEAFSMKAKASKVRGKRPDADSSEVTVSEPAESDEAFSMKASKLRKKKKKSKQG